MTQYTKMIDNNGEVQSVEEGRVNRFLSEGWTIVGQPKEEKKVTKSKGSKDKITADAQVTSKASEEIEQECPKCGGDHAYENCDQDEDWDFSEDDFQTAKKED